MSLTLNRRVKTILQSGLYTLRQHQADILAKWSDMPHYLRENQNNMAEELEVAVAFFSDYLFSEEEDLENFFKQLPILWGELPIRFRPNHTIFIITLLENAVHEAIEPDGQDFYRKHQAIQYLFTKMIEALLPDPLNRQLEMDTFLEQLVSSRQLPIHWVAKARKDENGFRIYKIFSKTEPHALIESPAEICADTLYMLSESLLKIMPLDEGQGKRILPIPWKDETILLCTSESEPHILPFITFALQQFHVGQEIDRFYKQDHLWKDAVILFNEWIMRSLTINEAVENITSGFVNYLPFERCALFSYSDRDMSGFGLFGYHINSEAIQSIRENITNIPLIYDLIRKVPFISEKTNKLQPIHISDAKKGLPEKYVRQFQLESVIIAPIFAPSAGKLLGAAILDQGPGKSFKVNRETYMALMKFGQSAGELLVKFERKGERPPWQKSIPHLSPREIEVLKLMAEGASTYEAARKLYLSEYTVRDYISSILQKMHARNRTEAVVKAIRDHII